MMRLLIAKYKKWKNDLHRLHIPQNYKNKDNFQKGSVYCLRGLQDNIKHSIQIIGVRGEEDKRKSHDQIFEDTY